MNKPRALRNNILVQVEWEKRTALKYGSLDLQIDPEFDSNSQEQGKYAAKNISKQTRGIVASLPAGFDPHYDIDRIAKEVQVGDLVYFHYNSIDEDSRLEIDGEVYYWLSYDMIFCAVRAGEIIMIGGRVLVDRVIDEDVHEINVNGVVTNVRMTKSGLITEIDVRYNLHKGILRHIGTPMAEEPDLGLKPGTIVYYQKDADFENEIEGHKYFVMTQDDLVATE